MDMIFFLNRFIFLFFCGWSRLKRRVTIRRRCTIIREVMRRRMKDDPWKRPEKRRKGSTGDRWTIYHMAVTQTPINGPICATEEENKHTEAQKATSSKPLRRSEINVLKSLYRKQLFWGTKLCICGRLEITSMTENCSFSLIYWCWGGENKYIKSTDSQV